MKQLLHALTIATLLLLSGCSYINGVGIKARPGSLTTLKGQLENFLHSKGFESEGPQRSGGFRLALQSRSDEMPRTGLYTFFDPKEDSLTFFIGKGNTSHFSEEERNIISDCITILVENADVIQSGFATKESSCKQTRASFYSKIKKM